MNAASGLDMVQKPLPGALAVVDGGWSPSIADTLRLPLRELAAFDRLLVRSLMIAGRKRILRVEGVENIQVDRDPFVLVANHSTRLEAILLPALLMLLRGGRRVHFIADWNFQIVPGLGLLYRRAGVITVTRKPARPRILTPLRALFRSDAAPAEQARRMLLAGRSVGIFPEGTVNRDARRLMRGRLGAARLSLDTGVPVVPAGLRFGAAGDGTAIPEGAPMTISFGPALRPAAGAEGPSLRAWHDEIMHAISVSCGKRYRPHGEEKSL